MNAPRPEWVADLLAEGAAELLGVLDELDSIMVTAGDVPDGEYRAIVHRLEERRRVLRAYVARQVQAWESTGSTQRAS